MSTAAQIWKVLISHGYTPAGAAGAMGNLYAESALSSTNVQDGYGYSDAYYTQAVDNGTISRSKFVHDSIGYGLAQWTYWSRKAGLYDLAKAKGVSIGSLGMQLEYLLTELGSGEYGNIETILRTTRDVYTATQQFMLQFERPDLSVTSASSRNQYSVGYYNTYSGMSIESIPDLVDSAVSGGSSTESTQNVGDPNKGQFNFLQCILTQSTGYSDGKLMSPKGILIHDTGVNDPTLKRYVQPSDKTSNKDELLNILGTNSAGNDWNHTSSDVSMHAFIGKLASGNVAVCQALSYTRTVSGCGSGYNGSCNDGWIQIDLCEDGKSDATYFSNVYKQLANFVAYLCNQYNINPLGTTTINGVPVPTILDHKAAYSYGLASNQQDVGDWFVTFKGSNYLQQLREDAFDKQTSAAVYNILTENGGSSEDALIQAEADSGTEKLKDAISNIVDSLTFDESSSLKTQYGSYSAYLQQMKLIHGGGAVSEADTLATREIVISPTPDRVSNQKSTGLLSTPTLVESPFITLKIGNYTFGTYTSKQSQNTLSVTYPNYMQSINIVKVNGTVNKYTIKMVYQIQAGEDPNLLDRIFSSVGYGTIKISYGDYSAPSFIYKEEEAIINKLQSSIDFSSSKISYTLTCTSNALALVGNAFDFGARTMKPSDRIMEVLFSSAYGLQNIFTGMSNQTIARTLIASDDKSVALLPKLSTDPLTYLNYLVSSMVPVGESTVDVGKSTYYLTVVDDTSNKYGGPYFKVSKVTSGTTAESLTASDVYTVDVGYSGYKDDSPSSLVTSFTIQNDDSWALLYNYSQSIETNSYVYQIDQDGNLQTVFSPNISRSSLTNTTTAIQKSWWTQMTQFPITASLTIKGLLRPAMLMTYVRINSMFYGQRHVSSGLYVITKQEDIVDSSGYRTVLTLLRVTGDNQYTFTTSGGLTV